MRSQGWLQMSMRELNSMTTDINSLWIIKVQSPSKRQISSSQIPIPPPKSSIARSKRSAMSMCQVCLRKLGQSRTSETTMSIPSQQIKIWLPIMNLYNNKIPLKLRKIKKRKTRTTVWPKLNYNKWQILKLIRPSCLSLLKIPPSRPMPKARRSLPKSKDKPNLVW